MEIMSKCRAKDCSSVNNRAVNTELSFFPTEVQKKLIELRLDKEEIKRCTYCGDSWVEETKFINGIREIRIIYVGRDNFGKTTWVILEDPQTRGKFAQTIY